METLVVVNVARLVGDGHCLQGDVDRVESDVDAKGAHDLLPGECTVGRGDLDLSNVPSRPMLANENGGADEEREGDAGEGGEPLAPGTRVGLVSIISVCNEK